MHACYMSIRSCDWYQNFLPSKSPNASIQKIISIKMRYNWSKFSPSDLIYWASILEEMEEEERNLCFIRWFRRNAVKKENYFYIKNICSITFYCRTFTLPFSGFLNSTYVSNIHTQNKKTTTTEWKTKKI